MRTVIAALGSAAVLGLAACSTVTTSPGASPAPHSSSSSPAAGQTSGNTPQGAPGTASPAPPATVPNVTSPWAVVSAYYGDIESGNYAEAWALLGSGATTGQTYQQFVGGFACTGSQQLSEVGATGNQVTFNLAATNTCTGQVQTYSGTDTVQNGMIVAANVQQTS